MNRNSLLTAAVLCYVCGLNFCDGLHACGAAKNFSNFRIPFAPDSHYVSNSHQREKCPNVLIAHANAAVRGRSADGSRFVGPVDAEALSAQTNPARTDRVVGTGRNHHSRVVVRWV